MHSTSSSGARFTLRPSFWKMLVSARLPRFKIGCNSVDPQMRHLATKAAPPAVSGLQPALRIDRYTRLARRIVVDRLVLLHVGGERIVHRPVIAFKARQPIALQNDVIREDDVASRPLQADRQIKLGDRHALESAVPAADFQQELARD